jgi:hypothetical protein
MGSGASGPGRCRPERAWVVGAAISALVAFGAPAGAAAATVPGAPTITSAVADVQNATVAFNQPAKDGGAPIFAYRATCASTDGSFTAANNGRTSPIRVGGLSVGRLYTCRVAARNVVGLGANSAPSALVIPQLSPHRAVPGAPTFAVATAEPAGISVGFGPPAYKVFGITSMYRAVCTSTDGGSPGSVRREHGGPIHVAPLTPGKTYTCYAQARDPYGWSAASPHSNAVVVRSAPTGPSAPEITSVQAGVRSVTVAFNGPPVGSWRIFGYRANCTSTDGGASGSRTGAHSPITVLGLAVGKTYTCTVTARDHFGAGPPSASSGAAVPLGSS